jgi:hypothetical protein
MKLRNKKTGEIVEFRYLQSDHVAPLVLSTRESDKPEMYTYNSLAELNEEWEDYEEKGNIFWYVDSDGGILCARSKHEGGYDFDDEQFSVDCKQIGNYFESEEEAEKTVEKLKAFKRLKDKGFRFTLTPATGSLDMTPDKFQIEITAEMPAKWFCCDAVQKDLDDCFGGEE